MLQQLGLQKYEKNFKNGLLTDRTLPLLTDRYVNLYICSLADQNGRETIAVYI
jgi:hypothetical protein